MLAILRDRLRGSDVWVAGSRDHHAFEDHLQPTEAAGAALSGMGGEVDPERCVVASTRSRLERLLFVAGCTGRGELDGVEIEDGSLCVGRTKPTVVDAVHLLANRLYGMLPRVRVTEVMGDVAQLRGFADCFTHLRTGYPGADLSALLAAILADGTNLGLSRMADATHGLSCHHMVDVAQWHINKNNYVSARLWPILTGGGWRSEGGLASGVSVERRRHAPPTTPLLHAHPGVEPLFLQRSWRHAEVLLGGAILAPGRRTVASILRITDLARERRFVNYHRVLNRAAWCPRAASRLLLGLLVSAFVPSGPVVLGLDDTIKRRRGRRIAARGIYRDPVRSSHGHFKASGLRWLSLMLLAPTPWAGRIWALPFLTALAPSQRCCQESGRRHKRLTDWARQIVLQARRWLPGRKLVVVDHSGFAALELLAAVSHQGVTCITRLRLDAALYDPAPLRLPGTNGRPRIKGRRLANLSDVLVDPATPSARQRDGLVWQKHVRHRDQHRRSGLASWWKAHRADPLGSRARSPRPLRPAGPALHRPGL